MFDTAVSIKADKSWSYVEKLISNMKKQDFLWKMSTDLWSWLFYTFPHSVVDVYYIKKDTSLHRVRTTEVFSVSANS